MTQREIKALLEHAYTREQWKKLVTTIFPGRDVFARPVDHEATTVAGKKQVQHIRQFGDVQLNDGNVVGLFEVSVAKDVDLSRNRVAIRKAVEQPVKQSGNSGALIAFVDEEQGLWRFSFYSNTLKENGTWDANNPKRYTYLLGQGEKCLTAARQFETLAKKTEPVTLKDLLEAFSVEKVSKAFFREYKEHYQKFVEHLTGKRMVKEKGKWVEKVTGKPAENKLTVYFNGNEKDARDFCKKLMGRLVFLYFLQKKRWLGATTSAYDDGELDFVLGLFQARPDKAFYPNILVPLFFDTLNAERKGDAYRMPDGGQRKVPFLNGGLFDKDSLDEKTQVLTFPPELFSHPAKADEEADRGFLDFLNAYNFTVHEAGPEEQTLAVDPEMLGHIFENLLEDNKDKGAFYTPKEIVHYMCQESLTQYLKNYLQKEVKGVKEDTALEDHLRAFLKDGTGASLAPYSGLLLKALHDVKVCDPAIGSGAFPMGILHEIFQAVYHLQEFSPDEFSSIWGMEHWEPAEVKLRVIQHSIYGVDIERGAVDIARLRFWLSIIVDERAPRTLPNLDYKIVVGDSLLGKFNGEVLEIDWNLKGNTDRVRDVRAAVEALHEKTELFFRDQPKAKKEKLAAEVRALKIDLLTKQLELNRDKFRGRMLSVGRIGDLTKKEQIRAAEERIQLAAYEETLGKLRTLAKQKDKPLDYFDWQLDFPEVLNANVTNDAGFDIVIANPPYVRVRELMEDSRNWLASKYSVAINQFDLFHLFVERSKGLIKRNGCVSFIIPNTILGNENCAPLREFILDNYSLLTLVDTRGYVFDEVAVEVAVLIMENSTAVPVGRYVEVIKAELVQKHMFDTREFRRNQNLTFIVTVDSSTHELIHELASRTVPLGQDFEVVTGIKEYQVGKGTPPQTAAHVEGRVFNAQRKVNKTYLPELRGTNLTRFNVQWNDEYISYGPWLAEPRQERFMHGKRVLLRQIPGKTGLVAATIEDSYVIDQTVFIVKRHDTTRTSEDTLLAYLNSQLLYWYFRNTFSEFDELFPKIKAKEVKALPIKLLSATADKLLGGLVQRRSTMTPSPEATALEREIDVLVCKLYGLSWEQAKVVDPELGLSQAEYDAIALPEREEPPTSMVSEPGGVHLRDHGTLFGQPLDEAEPSAPPKRSKRRTTAEDDQSLTSIGDTEREEVLQSIRKVFGTGSARDRETALHDVATELGYKRLGKNIRDVLSSDLITAVKRGILENDNGAYRLLARNLEDYDRDFLKASFLSAIGRNWVEREEAIRLLGRWLGFARAGSAMQEVGRSLIKGMIRTAHLEADGKDLIRRI
ncbi:MAG: N-6 DNA methylase [Bacteroidetes bacterium]|nr:N-6 DNA methylase [Bacteroidota bacterium]